MGGICNSARYYTGQLQSFKEKITTHSFHFHSGTQLLVKRLPWTTCTLYTTLHILQHEAEATTIAEGIGKVLKTNNSSKLKLQEPDPINSSNTCKLHTFNLQCKLKFQDCKDMFEDNTNKVNYILSYLKGIALDCFKSAVLDPIKPQWLLDFNLFIEELKANFGTYDPVSEAEAEIEGLCMHKSHQATK